MKSLISLALCFISLIYFASCQIPINTCFDLQSISNNMDGNYYLNNSLSCTNFVPLGSYVSLPFRGSLDGRGKSLYISITDTNSYTAIFRYCKNATISNINLSGQINAVGQSGGSEQYALLCGNTYSTEIHHIIVNNSKIESTSSNEISNVGFIAGFATVNSYIHHITVENSEIQGTTVFGFSRGSIAGRTENTTLDYCYNLGYPYQPTRVIVKGRGDVGGLVGQAHFTAIKNSGVFRGNIVCTVNNTGGIVGLGNTVSMDQVFVKEYVTIISGARGGNFFFFFSKY